MIAALMLGASFGAEWAGVCPALFMRPRMPWPWVHGGSNDAGFPPIKGHARRRRLAPTIQSEGEALQGGEVAYAVFRKRSSGSECATAKGRFQSPSLAGKRQAVEVYLDGHGRATDPTGRLRFMAEVLPLVAWQPTYDIILTAQAVLVGAGAGGRQSQWDADGACLLVRARLSLMSKDADNSPNPRRLKMNLHLLIVLALCGLLARPALAQAAEITPTGSIPLEVGNQWTYKQRYKNFSYRGSWWEQNPELQMLFEVPGGYRHPPDSLLWGEREFTIEVTHTERIDGLEYFVFSQAEYDWPPLPNLFWAGQKVRLSDEGVLLFRWNGQDVPLYDLNLQHPGSYALTKGTTMKRTITGYEYQGASLAKEVTGTRHSEVSA